MNWSTTSTHNRICNLAGKSQKQKLLQFLAYIIHHPEQDQTNTTFLDEITELLTSKLPNMENAIILGDFNMYIEDPTDNNSKIFVDMMEALGLKQQHSWTHSQKRKHTRPHFHWSHISNECKTTGDAWLHLQTTDSSLAIIDVKRDVLKLMKEENQKSQRSEPSYANGKLLHQPHLNKNTNTNEADNQFNLQLQEMLNKCAPEKIVKRPEKPQNLWFNQTLHEQWKIV